MTLQPHLLKTTQHDTTVAGKLFNPVTGRPETIDTLLAYRQDHLVEITCKMKLADVP